MKSNKLTKEERKDSLIKAASLLFMKKGYHETKTKDIAQAVGVTEPIIYKHFSGKQELFFEVIYEIASRLIDGLNIKKEVEPQEFLQKFIYLHMEKVEKHFDSIKFILVQIINEPEVRETFKTTLLPKMKKKIRPLIKNLNPEKEMFEFELFVLAGMLIVFEMAQGLFKYSPDSMSRKELSEKIASSFLAVIKNQREEK